MDTELFAANPELGRTSPDYVIYVPKGTDERIPDTGNEHFLVFRRKDGTFAAVWTQSGHEGQYNQHIVFAESDASARSWSAPRIIAGEKFDPETGRDMCSWGYPLVSRSGRIYVLYSKHIGVNDVFTHTTGRLAGIYSDDNGKSWSAEAYPDFPRSEYDSPDPAMPGNCITWQKPLRFGDGRYLAGITRWISPARATSSDGNWIHAPSVVDFLRFENLDDDPEIPDLKLTLLTAGKSLRFPIPDDPRGNSLIQEPTLNELPDGRLFAVMRTVAGTAAWSVSADGGESWSEPETLRYGDGLPPVEQPLSPCPCYTLSKGEYVLFYHNHDGHLHGIRQIRSRRQAAGPFFSSAFVDRQRQHRTEPPLRPGDVFELRVRRRQAGAVFSGPQAFSGRQGHRPGTAGKCGVSEKTRLIPAAQANGRSDVSLRAYS